MKLSEHFTLEELTFSSTAQRRNIDNNPGKDIVENMYKLAAGLEKVRELLGNLPMHIDSGYRSFALNTAVGGAHSSAHTRGWAADFTCPDFGDPITICQKIAASSILFDQVIQEGTWVHISFDPGLRRQLLTAHFVPGGRTVYSLGVEAA